MVLFFVLLGVGCTPQCERSQFEASRSMLQPPPEFQFEILTEGDGNEVKEGDQLQLDYKVWLYDPNTSDNKGKLIKDTSQSGTPLSIIFGKEELIEGWKLGLKGLHAKEKRKLIVPASMAYGNEGAGDQIPRGSHLVYEIDVVSVVALPREASTAASPESSLIPSK